MYIGHTTVIFVDQRILGDIRLLVGPGMEHLQSSCDLTNCELLLVIHCQLFFRGLHIRKLLYSTLP